MIIHEVFLQPGNGSRTLIAKSVSEQKAWDKAEKWLFENYVPCKGSKLRSLNTLLNLCYSEERAWPIVRKRKEGEIIFNEADSISKIEE